jgi:hypothetical protein
MSEELIYEASGRTNAANFQIFKVRNEGDTVMRLIVTGESKWKVNAKSLRLLCAALLECDDNSIVEII